MNRDGGRPDSGVLWVIAAALVALGLIATVVVAATGDLADAADDLLTWPFAAAALLGVIGWWRDRQGAGERTAAAQAERDEARKEAEERGQRAEKAEKQARENEERAKDAEKRSNTERSTRGRVERAHRAEREWARELRDQVLRLHREQGSMGYTGDVRELVLKVSMELTASEKGLLLSRKDEDNDGDFDMVCAQGFENDATHSAVAQEFGGRVLRNDETVREDDSSKLRGEGRNEADDEIRNLLAVPIYIQDDFQGVVVLANREGGFEELDDDVLLALGDHAGAVLENGRLHGEMRESYMATVRVLSDAIEANDVSVRLHSEEVASYVAAVADRLEMGSSDREELVIASMLHDVGKIGISERILLKPGPLTPEERTAVQLHPRIGFRLIQKVPALEPIGPAVLHHHEHFDGGGYPAGLSGEQIPLQARVICVADSFSAMTTDRPYRDPMSEEDACVELERCAGTQFDPQVVTVFVEEVRRALAEGEKAEHSQPVLEDPELRARLTPGDRAFGQDAAAGVDSLTLLYGHRHMHEVAAAQAQQAEMQSTPFAVVMVQLTALSLVNETNGHAAGDEAIRVAARALQRAADNCGGTACRHGGRRLALIVPETAEEGGSALARDLALVLNADGPAAITAAAGWQMGDSGADVLDRARLALALRDTDTQPAAR